MVTNTYVFTDEIFQKQNAKRHPQVNQNNFEVTTMQHFPNQM